MTPHDFALLAQEAYTAVPDIGTADSASRAIIRETPAGLVVAFPGTNNVTCWLADLDVAPTPVDGAGDVHRGFWLAWQAIAAEVLAAIGDKPVTLVGHSLGAAIAIMAAISLTVSGKPPAAVFGFEPPRVSTGVNVAAVLRDVRVSLFKNGNDLVPDVPPGWNHAAPLMHIGAAACPFPNVSDHLIARVVEALAVAANTQD
ncbi:alpha/beta fold hydrolase [Paraburkholderia sp. GAS82]|uniref:alpha/beta fold hydrolase n=1 Tax=Paraburkholderia sp. GAS82 TaxID=3035137 RepID=UPI003D1D4174